MPTLSRSSVWRGGSLGRHVYQQTPLPSVDAQVRPGTSAVGASVSFQMPAGGQGTSDIQVWIAPADFDALALAMIMANSKAALRAFGKALISEAEGRPTFED